MDWDIIIEALNASVRDDAMRADVYRYLMLNGFHEEGENFVGEDDVFDQVWDEVAKNSSDDSFISSFDEFYEEQE
jgi:hypothetical protein